MTHAKTTLLTPLILIACSSIAASCTPATTPPAPTIAPASAEPLTPNRQPTTPTVQPSPTAIEPTPTPAPFQVCSPLAEISAADLSNHISNPYHPPQPGSDQPHQGIDLADYFGENRIAIEGRIINAVLDGRVAAIIADRFPYGNAILIETPLDNLPSDWVAALSLPNIQPEINLNPALTCPSMPVSISSSSEMTSLYLLYAHLQNTPGFLVGGLVNCGQPLGAIGSSGNALNPHLHLEARIGPGSAQLGPMAHYDPSATEDEMRSYCLWRVSGLFPLLDPTALFAPY